MRLRAAWVAVAAAVAASGAAAQGATAEGAYPTFKAGADLRVRQEYFEYIPVRTGGYARAIPTDNPTGENNYLRVRPRIWGQADLTPEARIYGRVTNEFRKYWEPDYDTSQAPYTYPDELVVDNLYLDLKGLFGNTLDIRAGRQDLVYGKGRVLLDGTPLDGSRTIYFDALKLSYRGVPDNVVDFLAISNSPENDLALHKPEVTRYLSGYTPTSDMKEKGAGVYWKSNMYKEFPFEAYYLYKEESEWTGPNLFPGGQQVGAVWEFPELNLSTVGVRLMPKLGDRVEANLELAYQWGDRGSADVEGVMVDALVNWTPPVLESAKPKVGAGWYYLSGDKQSTRNKDEGWNPLFARWPQYSELYVFAFDRDGAGRWSNVSMPHLDLELSPTPWYKAELMLGYMMAPEDNGPGGGNNRGLLFTWWNKFKLGEKLLTGSDKLTGHLLLEVLNPGNYYDDLSHNAVFARWEFMYAF